MPKSSTARIRANAKYNKSHYRQINVAVVPDMAASWQEAATAAGQSMRAYIIDAVEARRERETAITAIPTECPPDAQSTPAP